MKLLKKIAVLFALVLVPVILAVVLLAGYLSLTEYRPGEVETLPVTLSALRQVPAVGERLTAVTFNTGYAGLDRTQDFVMDGGKRARPDSEEAVRDNMAAMLSVLDSAGAQIVLLQEVDAPSARTFRIDQMDYYRRGLAMNAAMAYNYKCEFVPFPWPPIGKVQSGLVTLTELDVTKAERVSLPVPFSWPLRIANLKRCLLVERVPVENTEKELVIINLHLEAYDDGTGREAQMNRLIGLMEEERNKGNYVIAGGDFNAVFPDAPATPAVEPDGWQPQTLPELPTGFSYAYDAGSPTCRSLSKPYSGNRSQTQFYIIDGFIVSDNLKVNHVETLDLNFRNSDHHPVLLQVTLQ
ncbi:MAG: endonuclease [Clostridia bacterium]|nr:endonuclease [Clostridia bacterium]